MAWLPTVVGLRFHAWRLIIVGFYFFSLLICLLVFGHNHDHRVDSINCFEWVDLTLMDAKWKVCQSYFFSSISSDENACIRIFVLGCSNNRLLYRIQLEMRDVLSQNEIVMVALIALRYMWLCDFFNWQLTCESFIEFMINEWCRWLPNIIPLGVIHCVVHWTKANAPYISHFGYL